MAVGCLNAAVRAHRTAFAAAIGRALNSDCASSTAAELHAGVLTYAFVLHDNGGTRLLATSQTLEAHLALALGCTSSCCRGTVWAGLADPPIDSQQLPSLSGLDRHTSGN